MNGASAAGSVSTRRMPCQNPFASVFLSNHVPGPKTGRAIASRCFYVFFRACHLGPISISEQKKCYDCDGPDRPRKHFSTPDFFRRNESLALPR